MIIYPNAKINLGLRVVQKRADGYHDLETVFYPVGWKDILEVVQDDSQENGVTFSSAGISIPGNPEENLCVKAYHLIANDYPMPAVKVHLHKLIPIGAGLGGGSSDAAFFIRAVDRLFNLNLAWGELHHYAKQLGADCSFFITNKPCYAEGRGDELESILLSLQDYFIVIVYPEIPVSTADAFRGIVPQKPTTPLEEEISRLPVEEWKNAIVNDFEKTIFPKFPAIAAVKEKLYDLGAVYASMSGSGSAVFGIFREAIAAEENFPGCRCWSGPLS